MASVCLDWAILGSPRMLYPGWGCGVGLLIGTVGTFAIIVLFTVLVWSQRKIQRSIWKHQGRPLRYCNYPRKKDKCLNMIFGVNRRALSEVDWVLTVSEEFGRGNSK